MDETQQQENQNIEETQAAPVQPPTYSSAAPKKGKKAVGFFLMMLAVILVLGGGFYFIGKRNKESVKASPTPGSVMVQEDYSTPEPAASASPKAVDKAAIKISIKNGTGIPKEASYLSDKLKLLGYEDITAGNASSQDYTTTTVTFSSSLPQAIINEITNQLQSIYQDVKTAKSSSLNVDADIITGLRKGATAKPAATGTPAASASPQASASPTATPTPTSTP
jgi:hypothetical protein